MPTDHIIALLIAERDKLNRAIEALEVCPSRDVAVRRRIPSLPPLAPVARMDFETVVPES